MRSRLLALEWHRTSEHSKDHDRDSKDDDRAPISSVNILILMKTRAKITITIT